MRHRSGAGGPYWMAIGITLGVAALLILPVAARGAEQVDPLLAELMARAPGANHYARLQAQANAPVDFLAGDLAPAAPGGPMDTAQRFLDQFGPILGFPAGFSIAQAMRPLWAAAGGGDRASLTLAPAREGVVALAATLALVFGKGGGLVRVTGRYLKVDSVERGRLDGAQAVDLALASLRRRMGDVLLSGDGSMREYLDGESDGQLHHHYEVTLTVGQPPMPWSVLLGATGNVLTVRRAALGDGDGQGRVYSSYPQTGTAMEDLGALATTPDGHYYLAAADGTLQTRPDSGSFSVSDDGAFDAPAYRYGDQPRMDQYGALANASPMFMEADCFYHLSRARDRAKVWAEMGDQRAPYVGFDSSADPDTTCTDPGNPQTCTYVSSEVDNAYYCPDEKVIKFYNIAPGEPTVPAMDPSIGYHEYAHAIHHQWLRRDQGGDWIGPTPTGSDKSATEKSQPDESNQSWQLYLQAQALGEGFADFFSSCVSGDPDVGLMWLGGKPLRSATRPVGCPAGCTMDDVVPISDVTPPPAGFKSEFHVAGQVFSGACWEIREKLGTDVAAVLVMRALRDAAAPTTMTVAAINILMECGPDQAPTVKAILDRRHLLPPIY